MFVSLTERRLRTGWRLLLQGGMAFFLVTCCSVPVLFLPGALASGPISMQVMLASSVAGAIGITGATVIARRFFDLRTFRSLGFNTDGHTLPDLLIGFLIPAAQMALVYAVEVALGWTHWQGWAWESAQASVVAGGLLLSLAVFILVGYQEELLSRGYQLQNLIDGSGLRWALLLSSVIFAALHLFNPGAGPAAIVGLVFAGYFLAFGWLRTGRLWLSIGLHVGWNFFEGTVFGFQVSGLDLFTLMRHSVIGPAWATGGSFGPEAGAVIVPSYALGILLIVAYTHRRQRPPALSNASSPVSEPKTAS
jgi:membrane protease YdiL (CAAX protease family)